MIERESINLADDVNSDEDLRLFLQTRDQARNQHARASRDEKSEHQTSQLDLQRLDCDKADEFDSSSFVQAAIQNAEYKFSLGQTVTYRRFEAKVVRGYQATDGCIYYDIRFAVLGGSEEDGEEKKGIPERFLSLTRAAQKLADQGKQVTTQLSKTDKIPEKDKKTAPKKNRRAPRLSTRKASEDSLKQKESRHSSPEVRRKRKVFVTYTEESLHEESSSSIESSECSFIATDTEVSDDSLSGYLRARKSELIAESVADELAAAPKRKKKTNLVDSSEEDDMEINSPETPRSHRTDNHDPTSPSMPVLRRPRMNTLYRIDPSVPFTYRSQLGFHQVYLVEVKTDENGIHLYKIKYDDESTVEGVTADKLSCKPSDLFRLVMGGEESQNDSATSEIEAVESGATQFRAKGHFKRKRQMYQSPQLVRNISIDSTKLKKTMDDYQASRTFLSFDEASVIEIDNLFDFGKASLTVWLEVFVYKASLVASDERPLYTARILPRIAFYFGKRKTLKEYGFASFGPVSGLFNLKDSLKSECLFSAIKSAALLACIEPLSQSVKLAPKNIRETLTLPTGEINCLWAWSLVAAILIIITKEMSEQHLDLISRNLFLNSMGLIAHAPFKLQLRASLGSRGIAFNTEPDFEELIARARRELREHMELGSQKHADIVKASLMAIAVSYDHGFSDSSKQIIFQEDILRTGGFGVYGSETYMTIGKWKGLTFKEIAELPAAENYRQWIQNEQGITHELMKKLKFYIQKRKQFFLLGGRSITEDESAINVNNFKHWADKQIWACDSMIALLGLIKREIPFKDDRITYLTLTRLIFENAKLGLADHLLPVQIPCRTHLRSSLESDFVRPTRALLHRLQISI